MIHCRHENFRETHPPAPPSELILDTEDADYRHIVVLCNDCGAELTNCECVCDGEGHLDTECAVCSGSGWISKSTEPGLTR